MEPIYDEIAKEIENENERREEENNSIQIQNTQVSASKWVWIIGATAIDLATAFAVWQITFWWYGIIWFAAGVGGLTWSDWLRERIGNNRQQRKIAEDGLLVSWIAIAIMAVVSGATYILGSTKNPWIEVTVLIVTVTLFFYHVVQSYRFNILDDGYIERNNEARSAAEAERDIQVLKRSAKRVEHKLMVANRRNEYVEKYGPAMEAALGRNKSRSVPAKQPIIVARFTVNDLLNEINMSEDEVRNLIEMYQVKDPKDAWERLSSILPERISYSNFVELFNEITTHP